MTRSTRRGNNDVPPLHQESDEPHLLREIMRTYQALVTVFTRKVGMPAARLLLLRSLAKRHPAAVGILELAAQLGVNPAAVTRRVKDLTAEGLVTRRRDARDGRRCPVKLTAKGLRTFREIHERSHELERSLTAELEPTDIAAAIRVLTAVRTTVLGSTDIGGT